MNNMNFFKIFLSKAKTKIVKKKNPKPKIDFKQMVQMTKGSIITRIF